MATRKNHHDKQSFLYLGVGGERNTPAISSGDTAFEMDEFDVLNPTAGTSEQKKSTLSSSKTSRKPLKVRSSSHDHHVHERPITGKSLPVNVPDWSKILRDEYKHGTRENDDDVDIFDHDIEEDDRLPPHEYLARTRIASFSVHEGVGRTLKGRDLSSVRNAIWKQTGFED